MSTCRFCQKHSDDLLKYGRRHYAHPACYLDAGKSLGDLHAWQVGRFPWRVLKARGLTDAADLIVARDVSERVHKMGAR